MGGLIGMGSTQSSSSSSDVTKQTQQQQRMLMRQQQSLNQQSQALTAQANSLASAVPQMTAYQAPPATTALAEPPTATDTSGASAEAAKTQREKEARRRGYSSTIKAGETGGYTNPVTGSGSLLG
jgi:type II secretory pathway pseudopilin PulG